MSTLSASGADRVAGAKFIDPMVLARIGNLGLLAKVVVQGFMSGIHRAMYIGASTEFAEHRSYTPGDDVRHVDWKLFGRTDRLYLKQFEAEANADVVLALDVSGSMNFTSTGISKFDYGRFVTASLAWLARSQRDRVGLALLDNDVQQYRPPSGGQQAAFNHTLEGATAKGAGDVVLGINGLAARLTRRAIVVVVSDFYSSLDDIVNALDELRARGHEVIAVHVLDGNERTLDIGDVAVLEDMESGVRMPVVAERLREQYTEVLDAHIDGLRAQLGVRRMDYVLADTRVPLDAVLFGYLTARTRQSTAR